MADPELVRVLDYILNRCDEAAIEAVAAAVVRRRRELAMFGGFAKMPDPKRLAKEMAAQIDVGGAIEGLTNSIRDYAIRIIRQEAPELTDEQVEELTRAWIPSAGENAGGDGKEVPKDLLASMIDQFTSYSLGRMDSAEDAGLRGELGAWPQRYWKAFPQVIRLIITDFLKGQITEKDFRGKIAIALESR